MKQVQIILFQASNFNTTTHVWRKKTGVLKNVLKENLFCWGWVKSNLPVQNYISTRVSDKALVLMYFY